MDKAAELFGVAEVLLTRPCVTSVRGLVGFWVIMASQILLFEDETPELLSACLCLILMSPRYFFLNYLEWKATCSSVVFS